MPDEPGGEAAAWCRPLEQVLILEPVGDDAFRARVGPFGGEILGCATLAAARSCPERALHSLHSYFLRPLPPEQPVELRVERLRDGRRFAHRRVQVLWEGRLLYELQASFAAPAEGVEFQDATAAPDAPAPETLETEEEIARAEGWRRDEPGPLWGPLEWRWVGVPWQISAPAERSRYLGWVRPRFPLPDDRGLQAAALAFLADYHSHMAVARRLGGHFEPFGYTSLDQVLWIHRELPWDDWWLMTSESDVAHAGRALTRRWLHSRGGELVASMAQEQLIPDAPPR